MRAVRLADTGPEPHRARGGAAFGLCAPAAGSNCARLPGKPDLVFSSLRKVIFVHALYLARPFLETRRAPAKGATAPIGPARSPAIAPATAPRWRRSKAQGWAILTLWEC